MTTSIIIPVFNSEKYISRSIRSALSNKKYSDVEIVVINDCSTDHTLDSILPFMDKIIYLENDSNMGLPYTLNKGIISSTGKYIVRLDSDDWMHERLVDILSFSLDINNNFDAVATDYFLVDSCQNKLSHVSAFDHPIGCSIMFRREHLIDIGLYDPDMLWHEERELMYRFKKRYNVFNLPLPLYRYFKHGDNMTCDIPNMRTYEQILNEKTT